MVHSVQVLTQRMLIAFFVACFALLAGPLLTLASGHVPLRGDWRNATHRPVGLAPDPRLHSEAIVQVYASRTFGWRGAFAVHTWVAAKPAHAEQYTRYEVIGWRARFGGSPLSISDAVAPDAEWYGAAPYLVRDVRGAEADAIVAKLDAVAKRYPYETYRAWPGPNSNTFVAWLGREIPQLEVALPATAIGKDYLGGSIVGRAPSGSGFELSLAGLLGLSASRIDGFEVNLLGLNFGLSGSGLKLPLIGRIGPARHAAAAAR
ncbi:MAG TPA: DUF3750 domain-containing protein [Casimicrobiaceae bacterium]